MRSIASMGSPRPRALVAVAVVVSLIGLVLVGIRHWQGAGASAGAVNRTAIGTVVLVPGYGGGTDSLEALAVRLRAAGRSVVVLHLSGDGTGDLRVQARVLQDEVSALLAGGAPSVDVVGYSAGGVVARLWAGEFGGAALARRVVLLGSPNHGTEVAALGADFGGALCAVACMQLVPGSDLLVSLDQAGTPSGPEWVSIWTATDEVVTPPDSSRLDGAVNLSVQSVCPQEQVDHGSLPTDPVMQSLVVRALGAPLFEAPTSSDCASLTRG